MIPDVEPRGSSDNTGDQTSLVWDFIWTDERM